MSEMPNSTTPAVTAETMMAQAELFAEKIDRLEVGADDALHGLVLALHGAFASLRRCSGEEDSMSDRKAERRDISHDSILLLSAAGERGADQRQDFFARGRARFC